MYIIIAVAHREQYVYSSPHI